MIQNYEDHGLTMKNPTSDYYFCPVGDDFYEEFCCYEDFTPPLVPRKDVAIFYLNPKHYFDKNGCLYDGCIMAETDVPNRFEECIEGCYEILASEEEGRQILLDAGFIEKEMKL